MARRVVGLGVLLPIVGVGVAASIALEFELVRAALSPGVLRAIRIVALSVAAVPGLFSYIRAENRYAQAVEAEKVRAARTDLESLLGATIQNLFLHEPAGTVRANVMVVSGDHLSAVCGVNMRAHDDFDLKLKRGQGCAGAAWEQAVDGPLENCWRPVYAPQAQLTRGRLQSKWKLSDEQVRKTGHILWIVSVPLFRKGDGQRSFFGVLNYDGVIQPPVKPRRFQEHEFWSRCVAMGEKVAQALATNCAPVLNQVDSQPTRA